MWMDQYVAKSGTPASDKIQTFQWFDQRGLYYNSSLPWDPAFNDKGTYIADRQRRILGIWPIAGGSGPLPDQGPAVLDRQRRAGAQLAGDHDHPAGGQSVVGAPTPELHLFRAGHRVGGVRPVGRQKSGLVLSNIVTPVPVTLDGKTHTVTTSTWRTSPTPRRETR